MNKWGSYLSSGGYAGRKVTVLLDNGVKYTGILDVEQTNENVLFLVCGGNGQRLFYAFLSCSAISAVLPGDDDHD